MDNDSLNPTKSNFSGRNNIEKLDFQKVIQEKIPFTTLMTKVIQEIKDIDALAIWVYLSSLPPDWIVNKTHLQNHFKVGIRRLREIFSYLHRAHLLSYEQERNFDGSMGVLTIKILCGIDFDPNEPVKITKPKNTAGANSALADSTGGTLTARAENRPCGSDTLQIKHNNKSKIALTKKTKSFCDRKAENKKKHDFAQSMNQMAREAEQIKKHEELKRTPMPNNIKQMLRIPIKRN